jgi:hypothetical protein
MTCLFNALRQTLQRGKVSAKNIANTGSKEIKTVKGKLNKINRFFMILKTELLLIFTRIRLFENQLKYATDQIDIQLKYVYFPLHLQPELTTSALGQVYEDQGYAIECLSSILPDDWKIFVKENPKQITQESAYPMPDQWRDESLFFKRMQNNPKVVLLRDNIDTNYLLQYCQFVATITGTAGWEAIQDGKQALIFGNVWYKDFPGVTIFSSSTTVQEILNKKFSREDVEEAFEKMNRKIVPSSFDSSFIDSDKVNRGENARIMADALEKYIRYLFNTGS